MPRSVRKNFASEYTPLQTDELNNAVADINGIRVLPAFSGGIITIVIPARHDHEHDINQPPTDCLHEGSSCTKKYEFQVHKSLIESASEEWYRLVNNGMIEGSTGVITINETSNKIVEYFIEWLYTGDYARVKPPKKEKANAPPAPVVP